MPDGHLRLPLVGVVSWRRVEAGAVVVPATGLILIVLFVAASPWPGGLALRAVVGAVAGLAGTVAFARVVLAAMATARSELADAAGSERRAREQLDALHAAALAMTQDLTLTTVLTRVVDLSRQVIRSRYAALRVLTEEGPAGFLTSGLTPEEVARLGPLPEGRGVLGVVARASGSVRLARIREHPESAGFPPGHPEMASVLGTPVRFRDSTFGYIYLTEKEGGNEFNADDERTLERFAAHAAAAIANARLLAQVERLGRLAERERIGRELHDGTLQELFAVALRLQAALPLSADGVASADAAPVSAEAVSEAVAALSRVMADIRRYVFEPPPATDDPGVDLAAGLDRLVTDMASLADAPRVVPDLSLPADIAVSAPAAHEILQLVREALSNAVRHSAASTVRVVARVRDGTLVVTVQDDGVGFAPAAAVRVGHGIDNMHRRAALVGATLALQTGPGAGAAWTLTVPAAGLATGFAADLADAMAAAPVKPPIREEEVT